MKTHARHEADGWSASGQKIISADNAASIAAALEDGPIIVEQWKYRGSSSPDRLIFDDADEFARWLNDETYAGDSIYVWAFSDLCRDDNTIAAGKCPDDRDEVPARGAY